MSILFDPLQLGEIELNNRIVMAPLTRCRASEGRVPNDLMREYYLQRASAGMILTEATSVTPMGVGYPNTPGIWSDAQVAGWKKITDAVHAAGGKIVLQLWHVGRISDPIYLDGEKPVSASAIKPDGHVSLLRPKKDYETPRALETEEIAGVIEAYRLGAENALKAGFDGVELHAANGYLIDQFLQTSTNQRSDQYGGSLENRARLLLETIDAICTVWPAGKVGVHLSPRCDAHDMGDENPQETFTYVSRELGKRKLAFIFTREHKEAPGLSAEMKAAFGGPLIINQMLTKALAEELINKGEGDAAAWGQLFIANPDLVERYRQDAPLNEPVPETFYAEGTLGYTDYPFLS